MTGSMRPDLTSDRYGGLPDWSNSIANVRRVSMKTPPLRSRPSRVAGFDGARAAQLPADARISSAGAC
jgi:hypothetical protein